MKKIIFMGTPIFSARVLKGLIDAGYQVVAVVTQPDRPVGRKKILTPPPVKAVALDYAIPVFQPEKLSGSVEMASLLTLEADLIVTAAYGQYVPTKLLKYPPYKAINVHASLLPKYRGGAPIHYAIWQGDKETGISIMYMEKEMDAGDILAQASIPIGIRDDVGSMFDKLAILGRDLLLETLPRLFNGEIVAVKQDSSLVSYSPTIKKEDEELNWQQTAQEVYNHMRAFRPFPSTYTVLNGERIKIWDGYVVSQTEANHQPGTILEVNKAGIRVQCFQGEFLISEWQPSGKKPLRVEQWIHGIDGQKLIGQTFNLKEENNREN